MKKKLLFSLSILGILCSSCSKEESIGNDLNPDLNSIEENYEAYLKGYEITYPKNESTLNSADAVETVASDSYLAMIQDQLDQMHSKTDVSTRAFSYNAGMPVGVLKYNGTCGSYNEFHYLQDHQDGGFTKTVGEMGNTTVDKNRNTTWQFCLVPGTVSSSKEVVTDLRHYGGGVLLLSHYNYTSQDGTVNIYYRLHDDEDNKNANKILRQGGLPSNGNKIGECIFDKNTTFAWLFTGKAKNTNLGFKYGVIANSISESNASIHIDDEDSGNANRSTRHTYYSTNPSNPDIEPNKHYAGISADKNTTYYVKIYNN